MARRHGYTQEQIDGLAEFESRDDLAEKEKVVLRYAERMTLDPHHVDDELWNQLRAHFDEGEMIELSAAIGLFNYFNRFNDALLMEPTR